MSNNENKFFEISKNIIVLSTNIKHEFMVNEYSEIKFDKKTFNTYLLFKLIENSSCVENQIQRNEDYFNTYPNFDIIDNKKLLFTNEIKFKVKII